jgi:NADH dehydrogenase
MIWNWKQGCGQQRQLENFMVQNGVAASARVVIIGGGFAGVACARELMRHRKRCELVLFSRENHMVFQPLLPDVAGSSLNPRAVAPPLRQLLPGVECRTEEVLSINLKARNLVHVGHDGQNRLLSYDHVVIACGNSVNLNLLPGMASHALPLKSIGDAIAMRAHVMQQIERAELADSVEQRRFYLTFIVVGGGFSGVEVAGEINDLVRSASKRYPRIAASDISVTLLHSQAQILPEMPEPLRDFALTRMRRQGIKVLTSRTVAEVSRLGVRLADGQQVEGATVICTVGTTSNTLVARLEVKKERGRLSCLEDMRLPDHQGAWAIGDCAIVSNAFDGKAAPPTAQFAERQGRQCAQNILRVLKQQPTEAFRFKPIGMACGIGGRKGVAALFGIRFSGFLAWWLWRSAFLLKIPSLAQKLKVGIDWTWELLFARDLSHFRPTPSDPIARAHYGPGEVLLQPGHRIDALLSIESGEVELVKVDGHERQRLALFGSGDLLGAQTLKAFDDENLAISAVSAVDVFELGRDSLARLSKALKPIDQIVQRAVIQPRLSIWRSHPKAMQALSQLRIDQLPSQSQLFMVKVGTLVGPTFQGLIETQSGCALVLDNEALVGIVTRTDLLAGLAQGATRHTAIQTLMNRNLRTLTPEQSAAVAAELMADGGLKYLPIVDAQRRPLRLLTADDFVRFALSIER